MAGATIGWAGLALDDAPYSIDSIDGLIGGDEVRTSDLPYVARDGVIPGRDFRGGKSLVLTINVRADDDTSFNAAVSALASAFVIPQQTEQPLTFQLPGVANFQPAQILARPRRVALPYTVGWRSNHVVQAVVELYATDGSKYGQTTNTVTIAAPGSPGGFSWSVTWPLVWTGAGSGVATAYNAGNIATPAVIEIFGPLTNPVITDLVDGSRLAFSYTLPAGDSIVIDTRARSVLLNGTGNVYPFLDEAGWFWLQPGGNGIALTADAGTGTATITWSDAWQ